MCLDFADDASRILYEDSKAFLEGRKGHILTFASFANNFPGCTRAQLAQNIEYLCDVRCPLVKKVYVYADDSYGPVALDEQVVFQYIRSGVMYHPVNSAEIVEEAAQYIFIEFEVI